MNQMSIPPFWGVFCGVFGVHSQIWASEVPFFGTLKWALLAKVPIFKCQKMALRTAKSKNGLQKPCETPPKMVDQTFHSCVYHFWVGFKPILENCVFQTVLEPFSQPNGRHFSNHFPLMKTSTEIFQIFQAISKHKKAAKNTQAKLSEKVVKVMRYIQKVYNTKTFINFPQTSIMAWCKRALEKCEGPKDESHHAQRKSHEALKMVKAEKKRGW